MYQLMESWGNVQGLQMSILLDHSVNQPKLSNNIILSCLYSVVDTLNNTNH